MDPQEMQKELERLRAENQALKQPGSKELSFRVSPKGGVSVYGLGRFPVTLYQEQWKRLLEKKEELLQFLEAHQSELKTKD